MSKLERLTAAFSDVLRDLLPFVRSKKREKHSWRRLQPTTLLKVTLLHGCFSRFLNCTNGTKLRKTSHMIACKSISNTSLQ